MLAHVAQAGSGLLHSVACPSLRDYIAIHCNPQQGTELTSAGPEIISGLNDLNRYLRSLQNFEFRLSPPESHPTRKDSRGRDWSWPKKQLRKPQSDAPAQQGTPRSQLLLFVAVDH